MNRKSQIKKKIVYFLQGSISLNCLFAPTMCFCFPQNYHQQYFLACNLAHIFPPGKQKNIPLCLSLLQKMPNCSPVSAHVIL